MMPIWWSCLLVWCAVLPVPVVLVRIDHSFHHRLDVDVDKVDHTPKKELLDEWNKSHDMDKIYNLAKTLQKGTTDVKSAFKYELDKKNHNRIAGVYGPLSLGISSNPSSGANWLCDFTYHHDQNQVRPSTYHTGHIVAASLGGSNNDPMNFFPQHAFSNTNGGCWKRCEDMTRETLEVMVKYNLKDTKTNKPCGIMYHIQFTYAQPDKLVPNGGLHYAMTSASCHDLLSTTVKSHGITSMAKVFAEKWTHKGKSNIDPKHLNGLVGLKYPWTNSKNTVCPSLQNDDLKKM